MNKLYYVPLGCSARGYFINEIAEKGNSRKRLGKFAFGSAQRRAAKPCF